MAVEISQIYIYKIIMDYYGQILKCSCDTCDGTNGTEQVCDRQTDRQTDEQIVIAVFFAILGICNVLFLFYFTRAECPNELQLYRHY